MSRKPAVLRDDNVTIACFPPGYVGPLLDCIEYKSRHSTFVLGHLVAKPSPPETYQRLQQIVKPPRIINGYGPTETVVTPMIWRAYPQDKLNSAYAPIGQPVGERRLYV